MKNPENKTNLKKKHRLLWVSLVLCLVGVAMAVAGLMSGAEKTISWRGGRPVVQRLLTTDETLPKSVHTLKIEATRLPIIVERGHRFAVKSQIFNHHADVAVNDGVATISAKANPDGMAISLEDTWEKERLVVTVPEGQKLKLINARSYGGFAANQSIIHQVSADNMVVSNHSGVPFVLDKVTVQHLLKITDEAGGGSLNRVKTHDLDATLDGWYFDIEGLTLTGQGQIKLNGFGNNLSLTGAHRFDVISVLKYDDANTESFLDVDNHDKKLPYIAVAPEAHANDAKVKAALTQLKDKMNQAQKISEQEAALREVSDRSERVTRRTELEVKREKLQDQISKIQTQTKLPNSLIIISNGAQINLNH